MLTVVFVTSGVLELEVNTLKLLVSTYISNHIIVLILVEKVAEVRLSVLARSVVVKRFSNLSNFFCILCIVILNLFG